MSEQSGKMPQKGPAGKNTSNTIRGAIFAVVVIFFCVLAINGFNNNQAHKAEVALSDVIMRANDPEGNIKKITVTGSSLEITLKDKDVPTEISRKDPSGTLYDQGLIDYCAELKSEEKVKCLEKYPVIEYKEDVDIMGIILNVALTVLPILAIFLFLSYMMKQAQSANNQSMSFGKSRARLYGPDKKRVTFKDVAGNESAKQDQICLLLF